MPSMTFLGIPADSGRPTEAEQAGWIVSTILGPLDAAAQSDAWRQLSRSPGQAVWVHWAGLTPPDLASVRRFRVSCPDTRILIEVPEDLAPPDATLAQVVGLGIYDILRPSSPLATVLARAVTYADVAAWQGPVRTFDDPDPVKIVEKVVTQVVEKEKIVEKRIATTARPTLIAVWSA
ncbi:MAG: hypothetical protein M0Z36_01725, partial [Thermaerobacter sp.]|nr:hypothetical protein [Thermaerobacter sp.]